MSGADKSDDARQAEAESMEKFRAAARRERASRGASRDEHLRVLDESIRTEGEAIEEFRRAVESSTEKGDNR